ncbi:MAG: type II secretion system F family protein [Bacillota bacterium]
MALLIASTSILALLVTLICCRETIRREAIKKQQLKWIRKDTLYVDEELEKSFYQRFISTALKRALAQLSKLSKGRSANPSKNNERSVRMMNELRLAGIHLPVQEFMLLRLLVTAGVLLVGIAAVLLLQADYQINLLIVLFTLVAAVLIPRLFLRSRIRSRQLAIQNQMPNVMDVLCVSIEAGLSFDSALLKVTERFKGPLIEELSQVYREVQMGRPRREALASLSQRSNVSELQTFASAVVQSEQFGTPMKNVLRAQAQQLRINRRQMAQEKGMKAPVRMMLPMVLFIFPVIFIILLGPTVIKVIK